MIEPLKRARALLRAVYATTLLDDPDKRARASIDKLDTVLAERSHALAESTQKVARDL